MVPRTATTGASHPDAVEFVRFCYHRRRVGWPELYDEMCAVAGRGLYRGLSTDDLGGIGVGFSLFDMPALAGLAARVVAEEVALRRPVAVVITPSPVTASSADTGLTEPTPVDRMPTGPTPVDRIPTPVGTDDRSFDVPVRLALVSSGV